MVRECVRPMQPGEQRACRHEDFFHLAWPWIRTSGSRHCHLVPWVSSIFHVDRTTLRWRSTKLLSNLSSRHFVGSSVRHFVGAVREIWVAWRVMKSRFSPPRPFQDLGFLATIRDATCRTQNPKIEIARDAWSTIEEGAFAPSSPVL